MADLFWLAFSWMRASLLKLDLAFLRPLISFVQRSGFAVEDESRAVDFRLGQCVANWTPLLVFACGLCVTSIKIDPFEHGEVFVLDDGGKVDLDLGNYERFLDVILTGTTTLPLGRYIRWCLYFPNIYPLHEMLIFSFNGLPHFYILKSICVG